MWNVEGSLFSFVSSVSFVSKLLIFYIDSSVSSVSSVSALLGPALRGSFFHVPRSTFILS